MGESGFIELDLGKNIETIVRQWRLILVCVLIFAIVAGTTTVTSQKSYAASVLIASTKVTSSVSFDSAIKTLTEEQLIAEAGSAAYGLVDRKARQESYLAMVDNPDIAQQVLDKMGNELDEGARTIPALLEMVKGTSVGNSDSIRISVTYKDPATAAKLANTWGQAYVERINAVYSESGSSASFLTIHSQTAEAKDTFDKASAALQEYTSKSRVDELNRQINEKLALIDSLDKGRGAAVGTVIDEQIKAQMEVIQKYYNAQSENELLALQSDQEGRRKLITAYVDALTGLRQTVFEEQAKNLQIQLTETYTETRRVQQLLTNAEDMLAQVKQGGEAAAASNALALTLLKTQAFAANEGAANLQFQTSPAPTSQAGMVVDLESLIKALNNRLEALDKKIKELSDASINNQGFSYLDQSLDPSSELAKVIQERYPELFQPGALAKMSLDAVEKGNPLSEEAQSRAQSLLALKGLENILSASYENTPVEQKIRELEQSVRELRAQLSQEVDTQDELTRARDLAWETYKTLATKTAELGVAAQTKSTEVALAVPASIPDKDMVSGITTVATASALGLLFGLLLVIVIEVSWRYRGIEPHPIQLSRYIKFSLRSPKEKDAGEKKAE